MPRRLSDARCTATRRFYRGQHHEWLAGLAKLECQAEPTAAMTPFAAHAMAGAVRSDILRVRVVYLGIHLRSGYRVTLGGPLPQVKQLATLGAEGSRRQILQDNRSSANRATGSLLSG